MVNPLDVVLQFVYKNIVFILIIGGLGYFAYKYFKLTKKNLKIIDRAEIERARFLDRMKPNVMTKKTYLYRGEKQLLGLITHHRAFLKESEETEEVKGKKKEEIPRYPIEQFVIKPCIFKISNPFIKSNPFQLNGEKITKTGENWYIPSWLSIDKEFGIFYDESIIETHRMIIKKDDVLRTDLNNLASVYYVKSQEQCTFDPVYAHDMALREKELQIELAKKKGVQETI